MLLSIVFASVLTAAPASCGDFVGNYLTAGLPSGSTVEVTVQRRSALAVEEASGVLTLEYAPYPRVAGSLAGDGVFVAVDRGVLRLELPGGSVQPAGCVGESIVYGATDDAVVTLVLRR